MHKRCKSWFNNISQTTFDAVPGEGDVTSHIPGVGTKFKDEKYQDKDFGLD